MSSTFCQRIARGEVLVSDGATGSNHQSRGLPHGTPTEKMLLDQPEKVIRLHQDFIEAGADIILTNTFGGNPIRLEAAGIHDRAAELNRIAVELARQATVNQPGKYQKPTLVAGSIGPSGQLLKPFGPLEEEDVFDSYSLQAGALSDAGVDLLVVETQFDLNEARIALQAVRSVSSLPLVCSFSYDSGTRTMMGVNPTQMAAEISSLEAVAGAVESNELLLGVNCGRSLGENLTALQELRLATSLPLWFKPNAGMPGTDTEGKTIYDIKPEEMGALVPQWIDAGAQVVGGCCGTSPQHLEAIARAVREEN